MRYPVELNPGLPGVSQTRPWSALAQSWAPDTAQPCLQLLVYKAQKNVMENSLKSKCLTWSHKKNTNWTFNLFYEWKIGYLQRSKAFLKKRFQFKQTFDLREFSTSFAGLGERNMIFFHSTMPANNRAIAAVKKAADLQGWEIEKCDIFHTKRHLKLNLPFIEKYNRKLCLNFKMWLPISLMQWWILPGPSLP